MGVFATKIQSKITNPVCGCCGNKQWEVVEPDANGLTPFIMMTSQTGNVQIPPPGFPVVACVCTNCNHIRFHVIPN